MNRSLRPTVLSFSAAALLLVSCAQGQSNQPSAGSVELAGPVGAQATVGQQPAPKRQAQHDFSPGGPISDADLAKYYVTLACEVDGKDVGTMTVGLWTDAAPITTRNFLRLCDEGFYDGLTFHRILRSFMVQGGDPTATGTGNSPHGTIQAEFSTDPARAHRYGVLSMARMGNDPNSASCQFFLCCDEGPSVWNLDGKYSSFGRITSGVATLEALADVPTKAEGREKSVPLQKAAITRAEVHEGAAPAGETIERPQETPDLNGEPAKIAIQHVLISFAGTRTTATRTKEEAERLAKEVLEKARGGADFVELVRSLSDDPVRPDDPNPGVYRLLNRGVRDMANERAQFEIQRDFQEAITALREQLQKGEIQQEEYQAKGQELQKAAMAKMSGMQWMQRDGMVSAFGDVGFGLAVGEVGMAEYDAKASPFGWHIIRRLE